MTEPESEAESLSSDGEEGANFKVYYQDLLDLEIPPVKAKCKGCGAKFPLNKPKGHRMADCPTVVRFYEHCLLQCPPYITAGTFLAFHCSSANPNVFCVPFFRRHENVHSMQTLLYEPGKF